MRFRRGRRRFGRRMRGRIRVHRRRRSRGRALRIGYRM